jgi:hypothetical protein
MVILCILFIDKPDQNSKGEKENIFFCQYFKDFLFRFIIIPKSFLKKKINTIVDRGIGSKFEWEGYTFSPPQLLC